LIDSFFTPNNPMKKKTAQTVTEVRILGAAAQLFARQGFKGTSTRDISRLARVNEVTLYRYFRNKSDLFRAATEFRLSRVRMGRDLQNMLANDAEVHVTVPLLTEFLLENFFSPPDVLRLVLVAGFEVPGAGRMVREYLGPFFDTINGYFGRCSAKGMIREVEPALATLSLPGMITAHHHLHQLLTGKELDWGPARSVPMYTNFLLAALGQKPSRSRDS